jgi:hypothetical protein
MMIAKQKPYRGYVITRRMFGHQMMFVALNGNEVFARDYTISELRQRIDRMLACQ